MGPVQRTETVISTPRQYNIVTAYQKQASILSCLFSYKWGILQGQHIVFFMFALISQQVDETF